MLYALLAILSGAAGGLIVFLTPKGSRRLRSIITLLFAASGAVFSWLDGLSVFAGKSVGWLRIGELAWSFDPDPLGAVFGLIASTLWLFATVYSFGYMAEKKRQRIYYAFFLISLSATVGVAFAGNLITLYLFYELLTLATYPLVIHERSPEAARAGTKYIMYNLSGAGAILIAIIITYRFAGNPDFIEGPVLAGVETPVMGWLLVMFIVGFGVKAAIMPLHRWLPSAMVAPTPVSALLHAVAVVYAGVFGVIRVVYSVFGHELAGQMSISPILPWVAAFSILAGVIVALRQDVLKRRLAYQTVSHLSYILLGAFTLEPWGLAGAMMQMITYPFMKMTLFFCAGIIAEQTGETRISRMKGVGRELLDDGRLYSRGFGNGRYAAMSTFWGKYYLMKGSVAGGMWPFAVVLAVSGLINAACFIPVAVEAFRGDKIQSCREKDTRTVWMFAPTALLVVIAVVTGLVPGIVWPGAEAVTDWFFR